MLQGLFLKTPTTFEKTVQNVCVIGGLLISLKK